MTRTLVIQPLPGIGDMVWHLPVLHAIAQQSSQHRVDVLTKPRSRADQLLAGDPAIDTVLWLEREQGRHRGAYGLLRLARELRARTYDEVWILHDSPRYALAARLAGIPRRIGYGPAWRRLLLSRQVVFRKSEMKLHPIAKSGLLLERLGIPRREPEPNLPVAEVALGRVRARFADVAMPWVAVGVGSSEPVKQWGAARFTDLCVRIGRETHASVVLVGGPAEVAMGEAIIQSAAQQGVTVVSALNLSIADTVALLGQSALYVGNDTGFLNIAAATGVDAIGLFGGSPPLSHSVRIHCILPDDGSQPRYGTTYMDRISVGAVHREVVRLLEAA